MVGLPVGLSVGRQARANRGLAERRRPPPAGMQESRTRSARPRWGRVAHFMYVRTPDRAEITPARRAAGCSRLSGSECRASAGPAGAHATQERVRASFARPRATGGGGAPPSTPAGPGRGGGGRREVGGGGQTGAKFSLGTAASACSQCPVQQVLDLIEGEVRRGQEFGIHEGQGHHQAVAVALHAHDRIVAVALHAVLRLRRLAV